MHKALNWLLSVYKGELAVGEQSVVVSAGETVSSNIHDTSGVDVCVLDTAITYN